jgi:hypothetical protein
MLIGQVPAIHRHEIKLKFGVALEHQLIAQLHRQTTFLFQPVAERILCRCAAPLIALSALRVESLLIPVYVSEHRYY